MKNKFLIVTLLVLGLNSCSKDFLNLNPDTSLSSASFFKNETQFNQALIASYSNLRGIASMGIYMDEMRSDNTFFTRYSADRGSETSVEAMAEFLDNSTTSAEPNNPGNRYGNAYQGIAKVNTILDQIGKNEHGMEQQKEDAISGEALFLRAFYYNDLVLHYGGVPLQLEEIVSEDGAVIPRNTATEVYDQIISDLITAIPKLSVPTTFPQSGRATKGAAKMLLAYAYMSKPTKEYAKAEAELLDITKMNYSLMDNYSDVFDPSLKNNKESIFEIQYLSGNSEQQSNFIWRFIPKTTNTEAILGLHGTNLRGGLTSGGWNVPTQELVDSYEIGDMRLPASIAVAEGIEEDEVFTTEAVKSVVDYTPTPGKTSYYFIKKYFHPPYAVEWNTDDNWSIYRYSGALLLLAECQVQQNKTGDALPYINQVRDRAHLPLLEEVTMDAVENEMRHELAFENHRWTDLIRQGNAIEALNDKGVRLKELYGWLLPSSFNVTENKLIYAIPDRELQINTNLIQNPGY
jgi:hypothetical protein